MSSARNDIRNLMESLRQIEESSTDFRKISYEQFERLVDSSVDYEQTEIDGHSILAAYQGNNCVGMYYQQAEIATANLEFTDDALSYSELDPYWPYGD